MTSDLSEQVWLTTSCTCQLTVGPPGSGDPLHLLVAGDVGPHSRHLVHDALVDACRRRAARLVVDLTELGHCDDAGRTLLERVGAELAAAHGTRYELVPPGDGLR